MFTPQISPKGEILVLALEDTPTHVMGIELPASAKRPSQIGVVVACGPGLFSHLTGQIIPLTTKVGERVMFFKDKGVMIMLPGPNDVMTEYKVIDESQVIGAIPEIKQQEQDIQTSSQAGLDIIA